MPLQLAIWPWNWSTHLEKSLKLERKIYQNSWTTLWLFLSRWNKNWLTVKFQVLLSCGAVSSGQKSLCTAELVKLVVYRCKWTAPYLHRDHWGDEKWRLFATRCSAEHVKSTVVDVLMKRNEVWWNVDSAINIPWHVTFYISPII